MISDTALIFELFKSHALVKLEEQNGRHRVSLSECNERDSSVTICNLPPDTVVVHVDTYFSNDRLFNGTRGECKRADFALISEMKKCILFVELKRTNDKEHDIIKQLKGAQCFMSYCQVIGKTFWNSAHFLADYHHRFVSFCHTGLDKRRTRMERKAPKNETPEAFLRESSPHQLQYNQLACLN